MVNCGYFWSRCDDELRSLCPGFNASTSRNDTIKQKIQTFLLYLRFFFTYSSNTLIQFWAPVRIAPKIYLTTADQPFAIPQLRKGLFSYRKFCLESILIQVDGDEEHNLGPPERVFRQGFPEFCGDISDYLKTEYPQRKCALEFGLKFYTALPLFDSGEKECIGVLEIISESNIYDFLVVHVFPALQKMNIRFGIYESFYRNCLSGQVIVSPKVYSLMESICRKYQLPLAQMWLTQMGERSHIYRVSQRPKHNSEFLHLFEGQGVVGKALSSRSSCFCHDITNLSINVYPMVPLVRKLELSSCFAICLKGRHNDRIYVLEFFFQSSVIDFGDPRNVVVKLVEDLEKEIGESENSFLQKLEKTLFVVITRFSSDPDILNSFEIRNAESPTSVSKDPQGMMPHDSLHPEVSGIDDEMSSHRIKLHHQVETSGELYTEPTTPIDEENMVQCARIKDGKNTLDVQYGITRDVLLQHKGKKLKDVADFFGVSRSTLKRICRKHKIYRWHHDRSRKSTSSHKAMAGSSNSQNFSFGPYTLKPVPVQFQFKGKFPILPAQQCLVDNIWKYHNTKAFPDFLQALVGHLANLNQNIHSLTMNNLQNISLTPEQPQRILEGKMKMIECDFNEKRKRIIELEKISETVDQLKKENEELKNEIINLVDKKENSFLMFPEKISEVKTEVMHLVLKKKIEDLVFVQTWLREMMISHSSYPDTIPGLSYSLLTYKNPSHNISVCKCERGFSLAFASLNLKYWTDISDLLSLRSFLELGFISRIVITSPSQVLQWIEPLSYKLATLLYSAFDDNYLQHGYLNLNIRSIPASFRTGFPDEARHTFVISSHSYKMPTHVIYVPPKEIFSEDILEDVSMARSFIMAKWPPMTLNPFTLLAEERNMRIYGSPHIIWKDVYIPFLGQIDENPSLTTHFKGYHLTHHLKQFGDYKECHENYHITDEMQEAALDAEIDNNDRDELDHDLD